MEDGRYSGIDYYRNEVMPKILQRNVSVFQPKTLSDRMRAAWLIFKGQTPVIDFSDRSYLWYVTPQQLHSFPRINSANQDSISNIGDVCTLPGFKKIKEQIREERGGAHIVDWGCGNGYKGIALYNLLQAHYLHLIDTKEALALAQKNCEEKGINHFETEGRLEGAILPEHAPYRFHLFLGNTISNFGRGERLQRVLSNISRQMRVGEYLLVEWTTFEPEKYGRQENMDFFFPYLAGAISGCPQPVLEAEAEAHPELKAALTYTAQLREPYTPRIECRFTVTEDFLAKIDNKKYGFSEGTVFIPAAIQRFTHSAISRHVGNAGLENVILKMEKRKLFDPDSKEHGTPTLPGDDRLSPCYEHYSKDKEYHYALFVKNREHNPLSLRQAAVPLMLTGAGVAAGIFLGSQIQMDKDAFNCQSVAITAPISPLQNQEKKIFECTTSDGSVTVRIPKNRDDSYLERQYGRPVVTIKNGKNRYFFRIPESAVPSVEEIVTIREKSSSGEEMPKRLIPVGDPSDF